jgi:membrane protein implicated in regulation of membrane protease activity
VQRPPGEFWVKPGRQVSLTVTARGGLLFALMAWVVWVVIAGVLGLAELHTLTLVLAMLGVAALPAAVVAGLDGSPAAQVATFAVAAVVLLGVVRPVARRHRHLPSALRTGAAALVGRQGVALTAVDDRGGQVRIGGEVWSARLYAPGSPAPEGATVDILAIDGATALVLPVPTNELEAQ